MKEASQGELKLPARVTDSWRCLPEAPNDTSVLQKHEGEEGMTDDLCYHCNCGFWSPISTGMMMHLNDNVKAGHKWTHAGTRPCIYEHEGQLTIASYAFIHILSVKLHKLRRIMFPEETEA